jgi:RNA polymerase sigma-70 factor (ECF subfamily)
MTRAQIHSDDAAETRLLLAAAQSGDQRAFRQLVEPYRAGLTVHCYRMLGSPQDAEDIVQETLLSAWRAIGRFEPRAQLQTWLYRIATNRCLNEIERRPRRPEPVAPFPDALVEAAAAPVYDPAARYALREGMELALLAAIQLLPGRQRAVLILRDVLGWTAAQVAELLDSTVASVNSALQRARATIDAQLPEARPRAAAGEERELLSRYVEAWDRDDFDALVRLLRDDAVLRMPPQQHVHGAQAIMSFFRDTAARGTFTNVRLVPARANGKPALVAYRRAPGGVLIGHGVLVLDVSGARVDAFDAFIEPSLADFFTSAAPV